MNIIKTLSAFGSKHATELCIGFAGGFSILAVIKTATNTSLALDAIEERKQELLENENDESYDLTNIEKIKVAGKYYISPALLLLTSLILLGGAYSNSINKQNALFAVATMSENTFRRYRKRVAEQIGEETEKNIKKKADKDVAEDRVKNNNTVILTESKNFECYDVFSDRKFYSDANAIKKAVIMLNYKLFGEDSVSLNEFYYELGLQGISYGEELGWNVMNGKVDVELTALLDEEDRPMISITFTNPPKYDYR